MEKNKNKVGKRRLPYYCNKPYILILQTLSKYDTLKLIDIARLNPLSHDSTHLCNQLKLLIKDKLVVKDGFFYTITAKGRVICDLGIIYFKRIKEINSIKEDYEILIKE